ARHQRDDRDHAHRQHRAQATLERRQPAGGQVQHAGKREGRPERGRDAGPARRPSRPEADPAVARAPAAATPRERQAEARRPHRAAKPTSPSSATRPATSSASDRPKSATSIATRVRRAGRTPPAAQESSASRKGKVLKVSSASTTGIRATAQYRP